MAVPSSYAEAAAARTQPPEVLKCRCRTAAGTQQDRPYPRGDETLITPCPYPAAAIVRRLAGPVWRVIKEKCCEKCREEASRGMMKNGPERSMDRGLLPPAPHSNFHTIESLFTRAQLYR